MKGILTVKDLMDKLAKCDPNSNVYLYHSLAEEAGFVMTVQEQETDKEPPYTKDDFFSDCPIKGAKYVMLSDLKKKYAPGYIE